MRVKSCYQWTQTEYAQRIIKFVRFWIAHITKQALTYLHLNVTLVQAISKEEQNPHSLVWIAVNKQMFFR